MTEPQVYLLSYTKHSRSSCKLQPATYRAKQQHYEGPRDASSSSLTTLRGHTDINEPHVPFVWFDMEGTACPYMACPHSSATVTSTATLNPNKPTLFVPAPLSPNMVPPSFELVWLLLVDEVVDVAPAFEEAVDIVVPRRCRCGGVIGEVEAALGVSMFVICGPAIAEGGIRKGFCGTACGSIESDMVGSRVMGSGASSQSFVGEGVIGVE